MVLLNHHSFYAQKSSYYAFKQGRMKWRNPRLALYDTLCNREGWKNFHHIRKELGFRLSSSMLAAKTAQPRWLLEFWGLVYSSSTSFFLAFKHKSLEIKILSNIIKNERNQPLLMNVQHPFQLFNLRIDTL